MPDQSEYWFFLKELFPGASPDLVRLLNGAVENANLLRDDFHTLRDWLEIAKCGHEESAHAILILMFAALEEGSLCIEIARPPLARRMRDFVPDAEADAWADRVLATLATDALAALIGSGPGDHKPIILHTVGARRFLYFQKYLRAELDFHAALDQRLASSSAAPIPNAKAIVREVSAGQAVQLDRDQQRAIDAALQRNFAVISGGPGTGKTSIVLTLLRCLVRAGVGADRIALAAPTGRAAQRLNDAIRAGLARLTTADDSPDTGLRGLSASTLHQLLAFRPSRNVFARHRENPIPADVVIVDEASMIGLVLMAQLLDATAPMAKLILLGDKDQLPSVDAGAILASLIPDDQSEPDHVVLLRTNHRSQEQIRAAAQAINSQDADLVDRLPAFQPGEDAGCFLLEQTLASAAELRGFLQHWIDDAYFQSRVDDTTLAELLDADDAGDDRLPRLFELLDRHRLLTLVREGPWGCDDINEFLALTLRPRLDQDARSALFVGAPVLITRNDASRGLFNGDVGITLRTPDAGLRVVFARQDGYLSIPAEALPAHELGFALTVHKSQGSEYQNVMVILPPTGGRRLMTKELLYTAITRAKSQAVICSTKEALRFAIGRRIVRESGLISAAC